MEQQPPKAHSATSPRPFLIHVVDDDEAVRDSMQILLESYGFAVRDYASAVDFLAVNKTLPVGCLLLDLHMPGMTGLELLEILRARGFDCPVILVTGRSDSQLRERASRAGAIALLDKPVDDDLLLGALNRATTNAAGIALR
jgi:FixJ family two-component response regulator